MAIDPASDIVLEVARAADPARAAAVTRRLNALADPTADFTAALDAAPSSAPASPQAAGAPDMRSRLAAIGAGKGDRTAAAQVQFEAVLLNSFVSEMLPKDAPAAYGQGYAGDMWRSMLADQVSRQIANSGALGIGRRLFATHPLSATAALTGPSPALGAGHAATAQMSANAVSMASSADYNEGAFLFTRGRRL